MISQEQLILIIAIAVMTIIGIVNVIMAIKWRGGTTIARFILNMIRSGIIIFMLLYSRFNMSIKVEKYLFLGFYLVIFLFSFINIFFKRYTLRDIFIESFITIGILPFFLLDLWNINILNAFPKNSDIALRFQSDSWTLNTIDYILLVNLLIHPVMDSIYSLLDELNKSISKNLSRFLTWFSFIVVGVALYASRYFEYGKIGAISLFLFYVLKLSQLSETIQKPYFWASEIYGYLYATI